MGLFLVVHRFEVAVTGGYFYAFFLKEVTALAKTEKIQINKIQGKGLCVR